MHEHDDLDDAVNGPDPTSRSAFRTLAKSVDATNRDADTLRHALLEQWSDNGGAHQLVLELRDLRKADADEHLAIWFMFCDQGTGQLVCDDDPILDGLSEELQARLVSTARPV